MRLIDRATCREEETMSTFQQMAQRLVALQVALHVLRVT